MDSRLRKSFLQLHFADVASPKTIANLWRNAMAERRQAPAYLHEVDGEWQRGQLGRGRRRGRRARERPPRARRPEGRLVRAARRARASSGRSSISRSALVGAVGAPVYANSSARDTQYVLEHSQTVGVLVEDDEQRAKVDGNGSARDPFAELDELRARGRDFAAEHPAALDERVATIDEDDLFTFIYTSGTTGPPKACMIRHRNYYSMVQKGDEMEQRLILPGRRDAPLPAARAQLRAAAAPVGGVHRLHDRVPARSAARGDGAAARPPDALPERAARLREDPHRRRRRSSRRRPASSAS